MQLGAKAIEQKMNIVHSNILNTVKGGTVCMWDVSNYVILAALQSVCHSLFLGALDPFIKVLPNTQLLSHASVECFQTVMKAIFWKSNMSDTSWAFAQAHTKLKIVGRRI